MRLRKFACCFLTALLTVSSLNMSVLAAENVPDNAAVQDADSMVTDADTVGDTVDDTDADTGVTTAEKTVTDEKVTVNKVGAAADMAPEAVEDMEEEAPLLASSDYQTVNIEYEGRLDEGVLPDNDELFAGYVDSVFNTGSDEPLLNRSTAGSTLTGANANLYSLLKEKITLVANGQLEDTAFTFSAADVYPKTDFTYAELGATPNDSAEINNAFKNNKIYPDFSAVILALTFDCPYEFYWFNKTVSYYYYSPYSYNSNDVTLGDVTIRLVPATAYAGSGQYKVNTTKTSAAKNAAANAEADINAASAMTDYEKLEYYRDAICGYVDYNDTANSSDGYGDPWQLIYVFDNDPTTDVVCEGYAKAFKYLCDRTGFNDNSIDCICVQGWGGSNGNTMEAHMWNVVHMDDGYNYHVDVTWYDSGWSNLFLAAMTDYQEYNGTYYQIYKKDSSNYAEYVLDDITKSMYTDTQLSIPEGDPYQPGDTTWQNDFHYELSSDDNNNDNKIILTSYMGYGNNVVIPSSAVIMDKRYKTAIKGGANFFENKNITSFKVLDGVSVSGSSMYQFFNGLGSLKSVDLRGLDTSEVTNMDQLFQGCVSLTSVRLDGIDTSNVTAMSYMFTACSSLENLDVSSLDTSSVKEMGCMFQFCAKLNGLNLKNFNTASCETMDAMFSGCSALTTLDISSFDTSDVLFMNSMFEDCSNLTSLNLGEIDTRSVMLASKMFKGCAKLQSITLPRYFLTTDMRNISSMFNGCTMLTSLDLGGWDLSKVTDSNKAADFLTGCTSLKQITVPLGLSLSVALPCTMYDDNGNTYEYLPIGRSQTLSLSSTAVAPKLNGLCDSPDGKTCLYKDGVLQSSETCMYEDANLGWVKLVNGVMDKGYNDLYQSLEIGTVKIKDGVWDSSYTDMFNSEVKGGWAKVKDGKFDGFYSDLYDSPTLGWIKVNSGMMDTGFNDLYCSPTLGWWKIADGKVDFGYSDLYDSSSYGWWLVSGGAVAFDYNDLFGSPTYGWWKVAGGTVDFGYSDLYESPTCGMWLINGGSVDFAYNSVYESPTLGKWKVEGGHAIEKVGGQSQVTIPDGLRLAEDGVWYLYQNGRIAEGFSDLYCDSIVGWWKIDNGVVDFGYSDLYESPSYGMWLISGGAVNFGYTGRYDSKTYGSYNVEGGYAVSKVSEVTMPDGLAPAADGNWYLYLDGKVATEFNDLYCDANYGWWKIANGVVDFGYNDLYCSPLYGWWKISGGTVDFGFNDLYCSPTCGWWLVLGGAVAFGYNDLFGSPTYGWWKVAGGCVDFGYDDLYGSPTCGWWKIAGGTVDFGYTGDYTSPVYGWWKIIGGMVDFNYNYNR